MQHINYSIFMLRCIHKWHLPNHFLLASGVLKGVTHERSHIYRFNYFTFLSKAHPTHNVSSATKLMNAPFSHLKPSFTKICIQMSFHFCYYYIHPIQLDRCPIPYSNVPCLLAIENHIFNRHIFV